MQLNAIGGGRYIEMIDGALAHVPAPEPKRKTRAPRRNRPPKPKQRKRTHSSMAHLKTLPGYRQWLSRDHQHSINNCGSSRGRMAGLPDGVGIEHIGAARDRARIIAMTEFEELNASLNEHDPIVAYAMKQILIMLNEPSGATVKHALIRTLLEYRKAKPVNPTAVTVTNNATQDTWATLITVTDKNADT